MNRGRDSNPVPGFHSLPPQPTHQAGAQQGDPLEAEGRRFGDRLRRRRRRARRHASKRIDVDARRLSLERSELDPVQDGVRVTHGLSPDELSRLLQADPRES
jgi:hypothetical protein